MMKDWTLHLTEICAFLVTVVINMTAPLIYPFVWILAIIISKTLFSNQADKSYIRAIVISAPIATLATMASIGANIELYLSILIGALVVISSEKIMDNGWFGKLIDQIITAIGDRIRGK